MSNKREPVLIDRDTRATIYSACGTTGCEINQLAHQISKWWPLEIRKGPDPNLPNPGQYAQWKFWLVYKNSNGTHRHVNVCKWHHDYIYRLWQEDMAFDVQEEEANERWAVRNGGRI